MIFREYFPAHQPGTDRAVVADDGRMILCRSDENGDDIYMMKADDIEYVTKLDLDVSTVIDEYGPTCEQFVLKADEDSIYWGIDDSVLGDPESTTQYLGIYRQDLHDHSSTVVFEKCYDEYINVLGSANNMVYMILDGKELISVNMETGEERSLCESNLLSGSNLIRLYEDGIIILGYAEIYWSDLVIGENGFYYVNATHSKIAGGGIYYYDSQKDKYIRIAN